MRRRTGARMVYPRSRIHDNAHERPEVGLGACRTTRSTHCWRCTASGRFLVGRDRIKLLEKVAEFGSIAKAAKFTGFSYKRPGTW